MKNLSDVSRKVAKENDWDPDLVSEVNRTYWKFIRKSLSHPQHQEVYIKYLGYFRTDPGLFFKRMFYYIKKIKVVTDMTMTDQKREQALADAHEGIRRLWTLKQILGWYPRQFKKKNPHVETE